MIWGSSIKLGICQPRFQLLQLMATKAMAHWITNYINGCNLYTCMASFPLHRHNLPWILFSWFYLSSFRVSSCHRILSSSSLINRSRTTKSFLSISSIPLYLFHSSEPDSPMEMERVTEFPHTHLDRRPRKRPRLGWDVAPQFPQVTDLFHQKIIFCLISLLFGFFCLLFLLDRADFFWFML